MKSITEQALNNVNVVGKLLDATFSSGKFEDGRAYDRVALTVRVPQTYSGREEISEISTSVIASQYTKNGKLNPGWRGIQDIRELKTAQQVGIEKADNIRLSGGSLAENNYVSRSGLLVNTWQIRTSFVGSGNNMKPSASFNVDVFIMDIHEELNRNQEPTGRLVVKGGVVQYGGKLDVIEFIAEKPDYVEFISRNWEPNMTVNIQGRIRMTSVEEVASGSDSSWGEDIPEVSTRRVSELIITKGSDTGKEEELAYDPVEIKKAFNVRKANIEQLQLNAKTKAMNKPAAAPSASKYDWE